MQSLQEATYDRSHDYLSGSPHLKHAHLRHHLLELVRKEIKAQRQVPPGVLEVGGGHGGYTEAVLAYGCPVTATEMSAPSVGRLRETYGLNPRFSALFDPDGSLEVLGDQTFSVVLCASVVHHIPDYVAFLQGPVFDHLTPGGSLVTVQDPLWYPTLPKLDAGLTKIGYFCWRVPRGNYLRGASTRLRRLRGIYDEDSPHDMVEYHVVRQGVDQDSIVSALAPRFESISLVRYWSSQSPTWQRIGHRLGRHNTFATVASGFLG